MDSRLDLNIDRRMLQKGSGEGPQKPRVCWGILAILGTHLPKSRVIIELSLCERHVGSGFSPSAGLCRVRTWEVTGLAQAFGVCQSLESFPNSKIIGVKPVGAIFSKTQHSNHKKMQRWLPPLEMAKTKVLYINSWLKIHDGRSASSCLEPGLQFKTSRG